MKKWEVGIVDKSGHAVSPDDPEAAEVWITASSPTGNLRQAIIVDLYTGGISMRGLHNDILIPATILMGFLRRRLGFADLRAYLTPVAVKSTAEGWVAFVGDHKVGAPNVSYESAEEARFAADRFKAWIVIGGVKHAAQMQS